METYVVRVWRPAHGLDPAASLAELHGTVLHPASGNEIPFANEAELLEALRQPPADDAV